MNKTPIVGSAHGDRQLGDSGKFDPKIKKEMMIDGKNNFLATHAIVLKINSYFFRL